MKKIFTCNSNGDTKELRKLEARSKQKRLSIEEHRKILGYRFLLGLLQDYVYWQESV
ncbi:hypothetical protein HN803_03610 [candidate division WWE3 bacterium]|jgi:hypothetical protein|nr:hypothetical protein [candidate division WWE3 bacterium]